MEDLKATNTNILLWSEAFNVRAMFVEYLPSQFHFQNQKYELINEYFSDYDYLLNDGGKIIGFSFMVDGTEEVLESSLVKGAKNVQIDYGSWLHFFLRTTHKFNIETVQVIGTRMYKSSSNDFILWIPDVEINRIDFDIDQEKDAFSLKNG
jgi:hypothetical protein